jgi:dTDP-D-glucose 4,6-dehydratase
VKLLVCGGAGFIGSNFVRIRVRDHGDEVVVLDKLKEGDTVKVKVLEVDKQGRIRLSMKAVAEDASA